jgi:hypothetical protein
MAVPLRIASAAARMLAREVRRRTTNLTAVEGEMVSMVSMMGWILGRERQGRGMVEGYPRARVRAVSAPTLPVLGPVVRKVRPLIWEEKSEAMVELSVVKLQWDMVMCGWRLSEVCGDY